MPSETVSAQSAAQPAPVIAKDRLDATAIGLIFLLSACWGFTQVTVKFANTGFQPVFQAGLRSVIACVLVLLWCWWRRINLFERDGTLWAGIAAGVLFGIEFVFIYVGLDYTSVSRSVLFVYLMPFVVAIGAHFLIPNERLTVLKMVGMIAAFGGLVVALFDKLSLPSQSALFGDLLCFLGAVAWGATTLVIKSTKLTMASPEKVLLYQLVVSAVMLVPLSLLFGPLIRDVTPLTVTAVLYQGIIVVAISYLVWFWLLRHYPAGDLSTFAFLTPVFGLLFGALLLSEPVGPQLLVALALLAIGLFLVAYRPRAATGLTPPAAGG
jgi:drug/metabolite transporter (DMT)-like permease